MTKRYERKPVDWKDVARELYNALKSVMPNAIYGHLDAEGQEAGERKLERARKAANRYTYIRYGKKGDPAP